MNIEYSICRTYMNVLSLFFVLGLNNPNSEGCIIVLFLPCSGTPLMPGCYFLLCVTVSYLDLPLLGRHTLDGTVDWKPSGCTVTVYICL